MKFLKNRGMVEETRKDGGTKVKRKTEKSKKNPIETLQNMKWEDDAIAALAGMDDLLDCHLRNTEGMLTGEFDVKAGMLKVVGRLIGKFAKENLQ